MKNLYLKRGNYWFARQVAGKRSWVNLQTRDLADAIKKSEELFDNPILNTGNLLEDDIKAFVAHKLAQNRYSRNSATTKVIALNQFADFMPDTATLQAVTAKHADMFYRTLQKRVAESTAQGYMMTLRSFFRWAVEVKRARLDNPVKVVQLARHDPTGRTKHVDKATKNKLITNATDDDLKFILYCGFESGLRKDEIIEARVDWFDNESVHVRKAEGTRLREGELRFRIKDRDERSIPLTAPFREFLKGYLKNKEPIDFALQPKVKHGKARYRYDFRRPFEDYMKAQKYDWVSPHVMRHSFASILATAGISIFKIAAWMGDDVRVVQRNYAHLLPGDKDIHALT
jgi:site-specific recombinase XerD